MESSIFGGSDWLTSLSKIIPVINPHHTQALFQFTRTILTSFNIAPNIYLIFNVGANPINTSPELLLEVAAPNLPVSLSHRCVPYKFQPRGCNNWPARAMFLGSAIANTKPPQRRSTPNGFGFKADLFTHFPNGCRVS